MTETGGGARPEHATSITCIMYIYINKSVMKRDIKLFLLFCMCVCVCVCGGVCVGGVWACENYVLYKIIHFFNYLFENICSSDVHDKLIHFLDAAT